MATCRRAFSYTRFSTTEQKDGRSAARQEEAAKTLAARNGWRLDERTFNDFGVSAYHGANATHGELAAFLDMVKEGRVPRGSVLIVENIDRLSRLPPDEATALIMSIVKAGVDVATTSPEQLYTAANIRQVGTWIPLQVACCLAAEESRKKGERVADAWANKRKLAAKTKVSKRGPFWLVLRGGKWDVVETLAALVRRMFTLAVDGYGVGRIARELHKEHPAGVNGKGWQPGAIAGILRSRAVLGEFQPHTGTCARKGRPKTRQPAGDAIKGYFPAIVSDADFYRAQAAMDGRRHGGGRTGGVPNLFNGILYDALDGQKMVINGTHGTQTLVSGGAIKRRPGSVYRSVPYALFERQILGQLAELKSSDVSGRPDEADDAVAALSGELTTVNRNLDALRARAEAAADVTVFLDMIAEADRRRRGVIARLEEAKAEAASHDGDTLGEFTSCVQLLDAAAAPDREALRQRIRAALRRLVGSMYAVVARRGWTLLVAVQVFLRAGGRRDYLVVQPGRDAEPRTESWPFPTDRGALDLRERTDAARLAEALGEVDAAELWEAMA